MKDNMSKAREAKQARVEAEIETGNLTFRTSQEYIEVITPDYDIFVLSDLIEVAALRNFLSRWVNDKRTRDNKLAKRNGTQGIYSQDA